MAQGRLNIQKVADNYKKLKRDLPKVIGNDGQRFFSKSFKDQGFTDQTYRRWKDRKGNTDPGRAILVKSGRLRRSVSRSLKETNFTRIRFSVDVPYAEYHNRGTDRIPRRKFMGQSQELNRIIKRKIISGVSSCFR